MVILTVMKSCDLKSGYPRMHLDEGFFSFRFPVSLSLCADAGKTTAYLRFKGKLEKCKWNEKNGSRTIEVLFSAKLLNLILIWVLRDTSMRYSS